MGSAPSKKDAKDDREAKDGPAPARKQRPRRQSVSAECPSEIPAWKKVTIEKSQEAKERIQRAVADNFLFTSLDSVQLTDIIDVMSERKVEAGEVIITEGESGDFFYVVDQGEFEVTVKETVVLNLKDGGSFGELALMYNCPRAATVKCKSSGTLFTIDRQAFHNIILIANQKKAAMYEEFLKEVPVLSNLTHAERSQIADNLLPQKHPANEVIIKQGDESKDMKFYLLAEGECNCFFIDHDGTRLDAGTVKRGGYFGEKALLEQSARAADVVAAVDCETVSMGVAAFERLLGPCVEVMQRRMQSYKSIEASRVESLGKMTEALDEFKKQKADSEAKSDAKAVDVDDASAAKATDDDLDAKAESK